jgi:hypothetical protein
MCHKPGSVFDTLAAQIPSEAAPLPLSNTPQYYNGGGELIAASTTYLKQDFSVMQPVEKPGQWPKMQRYDYFVSVKRELGQAPPTTLKPESRFQKAYDFALVGLGGSVPEVTMSTAETRLAETARFVALQLNAEALTVLKSDTPLMELGPVEMESTIRRLQQRHGLKTNRAALVAYLAELAETGDDKAAKMLKVVRGASVDIELPVKLANAVK